jgi:hypothetical protein
LHRGEKRDWPLGRGSVCGPTLGWHLRRYTPGSRCVTTTLHLLRGATARAAASTAAWRPRRLQPPVGRAGPLPAALTVLGAARARRLSAVVERLVLARSFRAAPLVGDVAAGSVLRTSSNAARREGVARQGSTAAGSVLRTSSNAARREGVARQGSTAAGLVLRTSSNAARREGVARQGSTAAESVLRTSSNAARREGVARQGSTAAGSVLHRSGAESRKRSGGTAWTGRLSVVKMGSCRAWGSSTHDWTPS